MRIRVYHLAKEIGLSSKLIIDLAKSNDMDINSPLNSLTPEQEQILRKLCKAEKARQATAAKHKGHKSHSSKEQGSKSKQEPVKQHEDARSAPQVSQPDRFSETQDRSPKPAVAPNVTAGLRPPKGTDKSSTGATTATQAPTHPHQVPESTKGTARKSKPERGRDTRFRKDSHPATHQKIKKHEEQREGQQQAHNKFHRPHKSHDKSHKPHKSHDKNSRRDSNRGRSGQRWESDKHKSNDFRERRRKAKETFKKKRQNARPAPKHAPERKVEISVPITLKDLSQALGIKANLIIQKLLTTSKEVVTLNKALDKDLVEEIAIHFDREIHIKEDQNPVDELLQKFAQKDDEADLQPRAPVVTFLGHVDHGKTSLLDRIRESDVASTEAGKITQHIGAYRVYVDGHPIVFLDTPGHEAFTAMRARGARVTDIVVLVVAADDGVMPQTVEAINHAKAAEVPIIVALNKIDKPNAKIEATLRQLADYDLLAEEWGGQTGVIQVSALEGKGIDNLLEYINLVAEMEELKANPKRPASGTVLEAKIVQGKGMVATLLVQNGTLHNGDYILCGNTYGRIRAMIDEHGREHKQAGPSTPIEVLGLSGLPEPGDRFYCVDDPNQAIAIAKERQKNVRERELARGGTGKFSLEDVLNRMKNGESQELQIILKTDVQGSLEAIRKKLNDFSVDEVKIKIKHAAVGGINESDIQLADATGAIIIGFNVTVERKARELAEERNIKILRYSIIYQLLDDIWKMMEERLLPEEKEEVTGHAVIRKIIRTSRFGNIAGCYVTDGVIERGCKIRVSRNGVVITKDRALDIASLRRFKDDVKEVKSGFECGIKLDGFEDIKQGDELEAFKIVQVARKL